VSQCEYVIFTANNIYYLIIPYKPDHVTGTDGLIKPFFEGQDDRKRNEQVI